MNTRASRLRRPLVLMFARMTLLILLVLAGAILIVSCASVQRKMLYFPSHHRGNGGLTPWLVDGKQIGMAREVTAPNAVWLLLHGNAGQAADRAYALPRFSPDDSVYILEYPGYGHRAGTPGREAFNTAAREAYQALRRRYSGIPVCVAGESIGSGPACALAAETPPPDKIVLVVPFDTLAKVAAQHLPFVPTRLLLRDRWDNIRALSGYKGPVEIFAAKRDTIIPISHAKNLADSVPGAVFHPIEGGHNDWAGNPAVRIAFQ